MLEIMKSRNNKYHLLGSRVNMISARGGYNASVDPVFLASSIPVFGRESVLDVGCGTGAAAFCLVARAEKVIVTGVDNQKYLIDLANKIAKLNEFKLRNKFLLYDIKEYINSSQLGTFDHVMANPPYNKKGSGNLSLDPLKSAANMEKNANLNDWVSFCVNHVNESGTVTFVHRYDRRFELISLLEEYGLVKVLPLCVRKYQGTAKRVLVQLTKGKLGRTRIKRGLILYEQDNVYTTIANGILRNAEPLVL